MKKLIIVVLMLLTSQVFAAKKEVPLISVSLGDELFQVAKDSTYPFNHEKKYFFTDLLSASALTKFIFKDPQGDIVIPETHFVSLDFVGGQLFDIRVAMTPDYVKEEYARLIYLKAEKGLNERGWVKTSNQKSLDTWIHEDTTKFQESWKRGSQITLLKVTRKNENEKKFLVEYDFYDGLLIQRVQNLQANLQIDSNPDKPLKNPEETYKKIKRGLEKLRLNNIVFIDGGHIFSHNVQDTPWGEISLVDKDKLSFWIATQKKPDPTQSQFKTVPITKVTFKEEFQAMKAYPKKDCGLKETWFKDSLLIGTLPQEDPMTRENGIMIPPGFTQEISKASLIEILNLAKDELKKYGLGEKFDQNVGKAIKLSGKFVRQDEKLWVLVIEPDLKEYFFLIWQKGNEPKKVLLRIDFVTGC